MNTMRCTQHGKLMMHLGGMLVCSACLATGSVTANSMMSEMRARGEESSLRRRLRAANIPSEFEEADFGNFVSENARARQLGEVLRGYCASFEAQRWVRPGFVFTGLTGTGKTHLACSMVSTLVRDGFTAVYISVPRFYKELRTCYGRPGAADALISSLTDCDFLVLDEIDLHGTSDADYNTLYDIVNSRYEKRVFPTLVISNRTLERLTTDLDERIISRILGGTKAIVFDWRSRREMPVAQRRNSAFQAGGARG
jgi:DNA replication protein DnaC